MTIKRSRIVCDIGILKIDYDCALHIYNNVISNLDASFRKKMGLLSVSTYLNEYQQESSNLALEHITEWGAGSPTTCGYQCVEDASMEDVEITQYFVAMVLEYAITSLDIGCIYSSHTVLLIKLWLQFLLKMVNYTLESTPVNQCLLGERVGHEVVSLPL